MPWYPWTNLQWRITVWREQYRANLRSSWVRIVEECQNSGRCSPVDQIDVARTMLYLNKKTQQPQARKRDYVNNEKDRCDLHNALKEIRIGRMAMRSNCEYPDSLIKEIGKKHGVPLSTMYLYAKRAAENDNANPEKIKKKRGRPPIINENDIHPFVQQCAARPSYCPVAVRDALMIRHPNLTKDQVTHYVKQTFRKLVEKYQRQQIWGNDHGNHSVTDVSRGMGEGDGSTTKKERGIPDWGGGGCNHSVTDVGRVMGEGDGSTVKKERHDDGGFKKHHQGH